MLCDGFSGVTTTERLSAVKSPMLPRERIPMLREVVLIVGDGRPTHEVGEAITRFALHTRMAFVAFFAGSASLKTVWNAGIAMAPPLFFDGDDNLHHVDPVLLAAVRAQQLTVCSCGAHYEVGMTCYLCAQRRWWKIG